MVSKSDTISILVVEDEDETREEIIQALRSLESSDDISLNICYMPNLTEFHIETEENHEKFNPKIHLDHDIVILDLKVPGDGKEIPAEFHVYGGGYIATLLQNKPCNIFVESGYLDSKEVPTLIHDTLSILSANQRLLKWKKDVDFKKTITNILDFVRKIAQAKSENLHLPLSEINTISFASKTNHPVLLLGSTGTGKEQFARLIHDWWKQAHEMEGPFVVLNCAMLNYNLLQDELCGHVRGAFTGADNHKLGKALLAAGLNSKMQSSKSTKMQGFQAKVREITDALICLQENFESLKESTASIDKYTETIKSAAKTITQLFEERLSALTNYFEVIKTRVSTNFSEDYVKWLMGSNKSYLERNDDSFDVKILPEKNNKRYGTLFLDEIGDMPIEAQAMILRLLSEEPEISPVGFEGRISGAKMRIIAATSNPYWLSYAGEGIKILPTSEGTKKYVEPRPDLFHRIAYHIIRVKDLETEDISFMIDTNKWTKDALERIRQAVENRQLSGHRRELKKIVQMLDELFTHAKSLGLAIGDKVTVDMLESIWKPTSVSSMALQDIWSANKSTMSTGLIESKNSWTFDDFVSNQIVNPPTNEYHMLNYLFKNLGRVVKFEDVKDYLQSVTSSVINRRSLEAAMNRLRGKVNDKQQKSGVVFIKRGYGLIKK